MTDYGKIAYEAYFAESGGKSLVSGAPLPTHEQQDPKIQLAWRLAANAAINVAIQDLRLAPRETKPAPLLTLVNDVTIAPKDLRSVGPVVPYRDGFACVFYLEGEERRSIIERKAVRAERNTPPDAEALQEAKAFVECERARLIAAWEAWLAAGA